MVRQSAPSTSCLMFSKVVWCSVVHVGNLQSHSLVVRGVKMLVYSTRASRNVAMYLVRPRNPLMLVVVVGCGQAAMRSVLQGSGFMQVPETMCPRKSSSVNRFDLARLQ